MESCVAHEVDASDFLDDSIVGSYILTDLASSSTKGLGGKLVIGVGIFQMLESVVT
jgi:hypothetical protein